MISFTILNFCIILCKIQGFVNVWKPKNVIVNKFYVNMPKLSADIHSYPMWKVQIYDNLDYDEQKIIDKLQFFIIGSISLILNKLRGLQFFCLLSEIISFNIFTFIK